MCGLTPAVASAETFSQGRSYGGTAYGVSGLLTLRRPGLPSGAIHDSKVGVKYNGRTDKVYVGYRTDPNGGGFCFYQRADTGVAPGTFPIVFITAQNVSGDRLGAEIVGADSQSLVFFVCNGPAVVDNQTSTKPAPVAFDNVIVRSYSTASNVFLTRTLSSDLRYQFRLGDAGATTNWGNSPLGFNPVSTSGGSCGVFETSFSFRYAFNSGC
jgi:hypothetical protein